MLRIVLVSGATLSLSAWAGLAADAQTVQPKTDRFGGTFNVLDADGPATCAALCGDSSFCLAWTYTPALSVSSARCELKSTLGTPRNHPFKTSGISPRVEARYPAAESEADYNLLGSVSETLDRADVPDKQAVKAPPPQFELLTEPEPLVIKAAYSQGKSGYLVSGAGAASLSTFFGD